MNLQAELLKKYGLPDEKSGVERRSPLYTEREQKMLNPTGPSLRDIRAAQIEELKREAAAKASPATS